MSDQRPPRSLKEYFWNVDFETLRVGYHADHIIGRLLETFAQPEAIAWMREAYGDARIRERIVRFQARGFSFEQVRLWVSRAEYDKWLQSRPPSTWSER